MASRRGCETLEFPGKAGLESAQQLGLVANPRPYEMFTSSLGGSGCPRRIRCKRSSRFRILSISRLRCVIERRTRSAMNLANGSRCWRAGEVYA